MRAEVIPSDKKKALYPSIMKDKNSSLIVLFWKHECGVSIVGNKSIEIGYELDSWAMNEFIPFDGEVVLSNN